MLSRKVRIPSSARSRRVLVDEAWLSVLDDGAAGSDVDEDCSI